MNKYVRTTLIFAGVWFIAALINGLLGGIAIVLLDTSPMSHDIGTVGLAFVISYVFSAPVVGLVWFIALMAQLNGKSGYSYFQFVLRTAFFCALAAAIIFVFTIGTEFMNARFAAAFCIVVSALASVLVFKKQIKGNG